MLYDLHTEQIVENDPIPVEVGLEVARLLRAALPDIAFAVETLDGFAHEPTYLARWDAGQQLAVAPLEAIYTGPALKLLARHEAMDPDALLAAARRGGRRPRVADPLVELRRCWRSRRPGCRRRAGWRGSRPGAGSTRRTWWRSATCPTTCRCWPGPGSAYAVAGGHPEVLAAVDRVVAGPGDDGVARELERLFGL